MFFLGVGTAIIGAASRNIGLAPSQIGYLISIQSVGLIVSVVVVGSLADITDKARLLFAASLILAVSFFLFYLKEPFLLNLVIMFFIGVGIGGYEGAADPLLLEIHKHRASLFISISAFFVTFGGLIIAIYLIFLQMDWRISIVQSAFAVLLLAILFGFSRVPPKGAVSNSFRSRLVFLRKQRAVVVLFLLLTCAAGIEIGMLGIITSYLMEFHSFTQITSKLGLITYLGGLGTGRLFLGGFARKEQILVYLLFLFGLTSLFLFILLYSSPGTSVTYVLLFISGLTLSIIFPLTISLTGFKYPGLSGTAIGVVKLGIPAGGILVPLLISVIAIAGSFRVSLVVFPLIGGIGGLLAYSNRKILAIQAEPKENNLAKIP